MKQKDLETYRKAVQCRNCSEYVDLEIPKGQTVDDFCRKTVCPNCGCNLHHDSPIWSDTGTNWAGGPYTLTYSKQ